MEACSQHTSGLKIGIMISQHWKTTYNHALHDLDLVVAHPSIPICNANLSMKSFSPTGLNPSSPAERLYKIKEFTTISSYQMIEQRSPISNSPM